MGRFGENVKQYLEANHVRQYYLALMTEWTASKVSRILNGEVEPKESDMQTIAEALGKDVSFFMQEKMEIEDETDKNSQLAFFAGKIEEDDKKTADKLVEMFRFYDALTVVEW